MSAARVSGSECTSYGVGHNVHFIRVLHAANLPQGRAVRVQARLERAEGRELVLSLAGGEQRLLHHAPEQILAVCGELPEEVMWNPRYSLLGVGDKRFSVATPELGLTPCVSLTRGRRVSVTDLLSASEIEGGFVVSAVDIEGLGADVLD